MERQMKGWELRMNKAFQLKLLTYQKLSLQLSEESCKNNFIQSWGLPIFQLFTVDKFM